MPGSEPSLSSQELAAAADGCNEYENDYYGTAWTPTSVAAAHDNPGTDPNQTKKLIRLLALIAIAAG